MKPRTGVGGGGGGGGGGVPAAQVSREGFFLGFREGRVLMGIMAPAAAAAAVCSRGG